MSATITRHKIAKRTAIIIAAILCFVLALGGAFVATNIKSSSDAANNGSNGGSGNNNGESGNNGSNVVDLSDEELVVAQENLKESFTLVPESSVIVSHVNMKTLSPEAQQQWWRQWFYNMLPPETTSMESIEGLEGINSITLAAYYPVENGGLGLVDDGTPLMYTVIFNIDNIKPLETVDQIAERSNSGYSHINIDPDMAGLINEDGSIQTDKESFVVSLTQVVGMEMDESLKQDAVNSLEPNLEWFSVDTEPVLYMNVGSYLDNFMKPSNASFLEENEIVKTSAFGIEGDFTWVGVSDDFGTSWTEKPDVAENENPEATMNPELIDPDKFMNTVLATMTEIQGLEDTLPGSDKEVDVEAGIANEGLSGLSEAISISSPGQEPIGIVTDPYGFPDRETQNITAPKAEASSNEHIIMFSPIRLQSVYRASTMPSFIRTITFYVNPERTNIVFDFKTPEQIQQASDNAENPVEQENVDPPSEEGIGTPPTGEQVPGAPENGEG